MNSRYMLVKRVDVPQMAFSLMEAHWNPSYVSTVTLLSIGEDRAVNILQQRSLWLGLCRTKTSTLLAAPQSLVEPGLLPT